VDIWFLPWSPAGCARNSEGADEAGEGVGRIQPSPTMAMAARAKAMAAQGIDVVDFGVGEPDFDTPGPIKEAAIAAIRAGFTKYTPPAGTDELKQAIVARLDADRGLRYQSNQIVVSCGAKHTLYNLAQALFESGDEVIIPAPCECRIPIKSCSTTRPRSSCPPTRRMGLSSILDVLRRRSRREPRR
jgi:DNA-binding transcriptional MocR family regulator